MREWTQGHCQSKFYTGLWCRSGRSGDIVFAHELSTRFVRFEARKTLYSFALTVPPRENSGGAEIIGPYMLSAVDNRLTTVERAYQLARSGECAGVKEIKERLLIEGFQDVSGQLYGSTITKALRLLCVAARSGSTALSK